MILAIDIGNTNIVLGCFDGDEIVFRERVATNRSATDLEYAATVKMALEMHNLSPEDLTGAIISSVVPPVTETLKKAVEKYANIRVMVVGPGIKTGLSINIDNPAQLGSDLVVGAVAAVNEYKAPMLIVDMGTATTVSVVDKSKNFLGGMIWPGVVTSLDSLANKTSQLPNISLVPPKKIIGSNTIDCMKSGIIYSTASSIDGIIEKIEEEIGESCTVVATGGIASTIIPFCKREIIYDDLLLLKGLMIIYNKNKS